jgi:RES domain-containing protein
LANAGELANDYVITTVDIPDDIWMLHRSADNLPSNWNAPQPVNDTRDLGSKWAQSLVTPVLIVPSAVVPPEKNYLLNPRHPDFSRIRFSVPEPFRFDPRFKRSSGG